MEQQEFYTFLSEATEAYRKQLKQELDVRWASLKLDLIKSFEFEVVWGLVSRQCSLVYQMSYSFFTWNELFLPIVLRCMVENYINISWITQQPSARSQMFIDYGLSSETKLIEYLRARIDKSEADEKFIKATESWIGQQRRHFLNEINVGSWNFSNIRKTAEEAGIKDYYDLMYPVASTATHSTWNYIAKHNLEFCKSPFHKDHRIPVIVEPEIEVEMFMILAKVMQDTFEKVDTSLGLTVNVQSSYELLKSSLYKSD